MGTGPVGRGMKGCLKRLKAGQTTKKERQKLRMLRSKIGDLGGKNASDNLPRKGASGEGTE